MDDEQQNSSFRSYIIKDSHQNMHWGSSYRCNEDKEFKLGL